MSVPSADAQTSVATAKEDLEIEKKRISEKNINDEKQRTDALNNQKRESEILTKTIYDISNPSPIVVTAIIIGILLILYVIYIIFLKPSVSGTWIDSLGNEWYLNHNTFKNIFTVSINDLPSGKGVLYDNYIRYGELIGIWDYSNTILFTNGITLERLL